MELVAEIAERPLGPLGPGEDADSRARGVALAANEKWLIAGPELAGSSDEGLVRAAMIGQREAFGELVGRYTNMLYCFLNARLRDPSEAEEITQEAMVRAFECLPQLRAPRAFANWLFTIATSVLSDKKRMDSKMIRLAGSSEETDPVETRTPADALSREEMRDAVYREIQRLPVHYRVVLSLKKLNGLSVEEISGRLRIPPGTVRSRLSRAYATLQRRLAPAVSGGAGGLEKPQDGET